MMSGDWADAPAGDEIEDAIDHFYSWDHPAHPRVRRTGTPRQGHHYSRNIVDTLDMLDWFTAESRGCYSLVCNKQRKPWYSCAIRGNDWGCEGSADTLELAACRAMLTARTRDELPVKADDTPHVPLTHES